jgi:hypothetical protein
MMVDPKKSNDFLLERLFELACHIEIAHHIPGRIRLKLKLAGLSVAQDIELENLMNFAGITETRTNIAARSIVISYDNALIAPELWDRLIDAGKNPSLRPPLKEELERLSALKS